jgi:hypothetical protein
MKWRDEAAILLGGATPFILRRTTSNIKGPGEHRVQHRIFEDCYVHGVMDGELVKDADTDSWPKSILIPSWRRLDRNQHKVN